MSYFILQDFLTEVLCVGILVKDCLSFRMPDSKERRARKKEQKRKMSFLSKLKLARTKDLLHKQSSSLGPASEDPSKNEKNLAEKPKDNPNESVVKEVNSTNGKEWTVVFLMFQRPIDKW